MGIGIIKIITGVILLALPLAVLLTPLTTFVGMIPEGTIPPEAMGPLTALLIGKTIADLPDVCDTVLAITAGFGGAPPEIVSACDLMTKYIPLALYALYGMIAIGALMILWGLSPLFMGKKKESHSPPEPEE